MLFFREAGRMVVVHDDGDDGHPFFCRAHSMVSFLVSTRCIVGGAKLYGSEWLEWRWARPWPRPFVGGPRLVLARFLLRDRTADRDAPGASPWRGRSGGAGGGSVRQRSGPWWAQQWAAKPAPGPKKLHQTRGGPPRVPKNPAPEIFGSHSIFGRGAGFASCPFVCPLPTTPPPSPSPHPSPAPPHPNIHPPPPPVNPLVNPPFPRHPPLSPLYLAVKPYESKKLGLVRKPLPQRVCVQKCACL